jgi:fermentation-respiration switch protein FrsA (DUF1100 family)
MLISLLLRGVIFVLIAYLVLLLYAYFFSDSAIFPIPIPGYQDSNEIIKLRTADGSRISALYLQNPEAKFILLYSHGNAEDLGYLEPTLIEYYHHGYSVFAYDYHGYGTSEGKPSEGALYQDIDAAYQYLTKHLKISPSRIILFGRSLGSGPTIDLAARVSVGGIIIESGFVTAFRVVTRWPLLPYDKFRNIDKVKYIDAPVLVVHGTLDSVIHFWHGKKLFAAMNHPKEHVWVKGAGHNTPFWTVDSRYWEVLKKFTDGLK